MAKGRIGTGRKICGEKNAFSHDEPPNSISIFITHDLTILGSKLEAMSGIMASLPRGEPFIAKKTAFMLFPWH